MAGMLLSALAFASGLGVGAVSAQSAKSTFDGVYTEAQSARGATAATAACAACHGQKLEGTDMGPGMAGPDFKLTWAGRSLAELFDKIKTTMPANDPGSLSPAATVDLVAFILKLNEYPVGTADLASDAATLGQIRIREK